MTLLFRYYEIRACVEFEDGVQSFLGPVVCNDYGDDVHTPEGAAIEALHAAEGRPVFWTIYGVDQNHQHLAIGDFKTFEDAYTTLVAILRPFLLAIDDCKNTSQIIEDILNQSSNDERL